MCSLALAVFVCGDLANSNCLLCVFGDFWVICRCSVFSFLCLLLKFGNCTENSVSQAVFFFGGGDSHQAVPISDQGPSRFLFPQAISLVLWGNIFTAFHVRVIDLMEVV